MALTELQLPDKKTFYNKMQHTASSVNQLMHEWGDISEFIDKVKAVDATAMGITDAQVIADMQDFRKVLNDILAVYEGNAVTPTVVGSEVIDKLRRM